MDIFLLIIIILILNYVLNETCNTSDKLEYFVYDSNKNGPTILMIAGTHGNEPAGSYSLENLKKKLDDKKIGIKKGKLIIISSVNKCGLKLNLRMIPFVWDLNRKYPTDKFYDKEYLKNYAPINAKIVELTEQADFILDFHEGWGFHRQNKNSIGSTISPSDTDIAHNIARILFDELNKTIKDDYKKFMILTTKKYLGHSGYSKKPDIVGSLSYFANSLKKNYILIETTGSNNIQPLKTRLEQNDIIINNILSYFSMV
jgi:hypothetical protein